MALLNVVDRNLNSGFPRLVRQAGPDRRRSDLMDSTMRYVVLQQVEVWDDVATGHDCA